MDIKLVQRDPLGRQGVDSLSGWWGGGLAPRTFPPPKSAGARNPELKENQNRVPSTINISQCFLFLLSFIVPLKIYEEYSSSGYFSFSAIFRSLN